MKNPILILFFMACTSAIHAQKEDSKADIIAKMATDLCQKFTGPIKVEAVDRRFARFHFFAKQIFDVDYPDYQKLMAIAPNELPNNLKKAVLVETFKTCPAYGEKYGFEDTLSPYYAQLNVPICVCFAKDYSELSLKKGEFKDDVWQDVRESCVEKLKLTDEAFVKTTEAAIMDLVARKKAKTDEEVKDVKDYFDANLFGSFLMHCAVVQDLYAQFIIHPENIPENEKILYAPERLQHLQKIMVSLRQNNTDALKKLYKNAQNFDANQSVITELIALLKKNPKVVPMLSNQTMTKEGMVEHYALLNVDTKSIEYCMAIIFDKTGSMNAIFRLDYVPKNKIPKEQLKKLEALVTTMLVMQAEERR